MGSELKIDCSTVGVAAGPGANITIRKLTLNTSLPNKRITDEFHLPPQIDTFRGRGQDLETLRTLFFVDGVKKVVISGLPGFGKTQLANEFARQSIKSGEVSKIFWIDAERQTDLIQSFRDLAKSYNMPDVDDRTIVQDIYKHFKEYNVLFIFDNGVNRREITEYEPPNDYYLLITSHEKNWGDDIASVPLDSLSPNSALEVYKSFLNGDYKNEDQELYVELAALVSYVPLGLQITAGYVRHQIKALGNKFILGYYIESLKQSQEDILNETIPSSIRNTYKDSIYGAVVVSLKKIETGKNIRRKELALNTLFVCSYLNPDSIKFNHLWTMANIKQILEGNKNGKNELILALSLLDNYSFISYKSSNSCVKIHRLVQDIIRLHISKHDLEIQSSCFTACLHFVFEHENYYSGHRSTVLLYAESNVTILYNIYKNHLSKNSEEYDNILRRLVQFGCIRSLETILNYIGERAKECIIEHELLHRAAEYNQLDILKLLLTYNVPINIKSNSGDTSLHEAARRWNLDVITFLIHNEAELNAQDGIGRTPLYVFISSAYNFQYDTNIAKINEILDLLECNKYKNNTEYKHDTLFNVAVTASRYNTKLLELLLERGFDVNSTNTPQDTPLHKAAKYQNIEAIKWLVAHDADLNAINDNGETPLFLFIKHGSIVKDNVNEMLNLLLFEENKSGTNNRGQTLLHTAMYSCNNRWVRLVASKMKLGDFLNKQNYRGDTPLHELIEYYKLDNKYNENENIIQIVKTLIQFGARLDIENKAGETPLETAQNKCKDMFNSNTDLTLYNKLLILLQGPKSNRE